MTGRGYTPILIDPLTGIETTCSVETLSSPSKPVILAETSENTLDFEQKTASRLTVNLGQPDNLAEPPKPPFFA